MVVHPVLAVGGDLLLPDRHRLLERVDGEATGREGLGAVGRGGHDHDGGLAHLEMARAMGDGDAGARPASGGLVGEPDQIIEMLRELEAAGLREVTPLPPMDCARECFSDFAEHVMAKY